jgi:ABC-type branched-subunit amino acid transport system substrate-binding protein
MTQFMACVHFNRRQALATLAGLALSSLVGAATSGPPVKVGGTLSLTGPLAQTSQLYKIASEMYVERLNKGDGLMGRPVEFILLDDQSKPELARSLYERLITVDKVDLLMGPYATGNILAVMTVAERYGKLLLHSSFGIPKLAKYERQIPVGPLGYTPEEGIPTIVLDGLAAAGKTPKTVAIVASKFPSVHFVGTGAREVMKKRGVKETLFLEYEFGARDFGPIAARVRDADPDLLFIGGIALESNLLLEALKKLNYTPRNHFHLYPAPGPLANSPDATNAISLTFFEDHPPFTSKPLGAEFARTFQERATKAGMPYTLLEMQGSGQLSSWQILEAAVNATKSLDDKVLTQWIKANPVETFAGKQSFTGPNNFGEFNYKLKQVQNGKWLVVYPPEFAAPGAKLVVK